MPVTDLATDCQHAFRQLLFILKWSKNPFVQVDQVLLARAHSIHQHLAADTHFLKRRDLLKLVLSHEGVKVSLNNVLAAAVDRIQQQRLKLTTLSELECLRVQHTLVVELDLP